MTTQPQPILRQLMPFGLAAFMLAVPAAYVAFVQLSTKQARQSEDATDGASDLNRATLLAASEPTPTNRLDLSRALLIQKLPDRAIPLLDQLVWEDPNNAAAWNNLCVARIQKQEYNLSTPHCKTAVQLNPSSRLFLNNLRWSQDEMQKTTQDLEAQLRVPLAKRDAAFYLLQGLNYYKVGDYAEALQAWQSSHRLAPLDAQAENNIGVAEMMLANYPTAEDAFRKAIILDPRSQLVKDNLSWAMSKKQRVH